MGLRFGQLAGLLAFVLMLGRLGKLFLSGPTEPQWNLILAASAFLGGVAWWLLGQMTSRRWLKLTIFGVAGLLLVTRISAAETALGGIVPTTSTLAAMGEQLEEAFRVIRSGVPPISVAQVPGLLTILATTMWGLGALFTWGSTGGPYAAMFLPPLVMYLQFAVFDRSQAWLGWLLACALVLALSVVSLALERHSETGRARDTEGRPMGRRSMNLAAAMAVLLGIGALVVADRASGIVDEYGNAPWRGGGSGAYGSGVGGFDPDRLVDLQQQVTSLSERPVFEAILSEGAPPANEVYWRMETLDRWDGDSWDRSDITFAPYVPGNPTANEYDTYQGPASDLLQAVRIVDLRGEVVPTAGVAVDIQPVQGNDEARDPTDFRILSDSALIVDPGLSAGDTYQVRSVQGDRFADLGVLATGEDGELTPMFAAAADGGDFPYEPGTVDEPAVAPPDLARYVEYPENTPAAIQNTSRAITAGAQSDYERAWMLQSWFRDSGEFIYSTNVSTGHDALVLEDWLSDNTSPNYRRGYCEQFAAAMGVMARTLEIPSRVVWGFTPGSVETQSDGTEKVVVRERNAHAWVELWMEPYGWVPFDPTPRSNQDPTFDEQPPSITAGFAPAEYLPETTAGDPLVAPNSNPGFLEPGLEFTEEGTASGATGGPRWWLIGIIALIPLVAAIPVYKWYRRRRRLARVSEGDITGAWDEIVDRLTDLGMDIPPSLTPIELARTTDSALMPLAVSYASTVYGGRTGQARDSDLHGAEWWIDRTYDGTARARAAMSVRSLLPRD